jgi:hypothetical protein
MESYDRGVRVDQLGETTRGRASMASPDGSVVMVLDGDRGRCVVGACRVEVHESEYR